MKKLISILMILILFSTPLKTYCIEKESKVHFLNTIQSDAIIIEGDSSNYLIDCGWSYCRGYILSYLKKNNINKIDGIIITHYHDDHRGDVVGICKALDVKRVYMSPHENKYKYELQESLKSIGVEVSFIKKGWNIKSGDVFLKAIGPNKPHDTIENNNSIVISGEIDGISYLFAGDMEAEEERDILENMTLSRYDVLKVPHHGLDTSSTEKFIEIVKPAVAVITSDGYESPGKKAMKNIENSGATIYRSDKNGNIIVKRSTDRAMKIQIITEFK